ncbi:ABC transporter substrate-binding protein [Paenibacillus sp. MAHUQ-46]|uniref:ABC transporter substrate-binding protein n=2 Tax=Paenibacillus TaxID=44249 RepID=A0A934J833_9BACL|nr:ABC transporter substrate-binding protein [Paenibacillus roseus]MBJ6362152.1 ABC transporter substrate-binding protein [Paenibacillus roseus]
MLKMKKWWAMTVLCSLMFLAACGGNTGAGNTGTAKPGSEASTNSGQPAKQEIPASKDPVTIEFWYGLGGKLGENMAKTIEKFNASQKDVIVKGIVQGDYSETEKKLQAAIASGQVPAAVLGSNVDWARKGYFAPLDELVKNDPNFKSEDFVQTFLNQGKVDGVQYFLPLYGTTQVMYYRKDAFQEQNIDPASLTTWEKLADAAAKMTKKEGNKTTFYGWEPMWGKDNMMDAVFGKGGKVLSDDGKQVLIDSPEWVETWEQFRKWIHEDKIMRIHSGGQGWEYWYKTIDDVMKGQAAGYTGSSGDQGDLDFNILGAMEQPGWEGKGEGKPVAEARLAGIPAKASKEQQEAAYKWFTFFSNTENTAKWSMDNGYIAVRHSALEDPEFKSFSESNPQISVPLRQASHGSEPFSDPTGGKINDALRIAADKVQIENISAAEALKAAKVIAQKELDKLK